VTEDALRDFRFDLSGVGIRLAALPAGIASFLESDWRLFTAERGPSPVLDLRVEATPVARFPGRFDPKAMRAEIAPDRARYELPEGSVEVDAQGEGRVVLGIVEGSRSYYALANLVRAALAWRMLSRGGALLHAAGILLRGRAFALAGPAGSGKSTWARLAEEAGASVLSDDLVLLDGHEGRIEALGAPFRSTHKGTVGPGRWPLAAILFPAHGSGAALTTVSGIEARARVLANLPFVAEGVARDRRVGETVDGLLAAVPTRVLTFGQDPEFIDTLESFRG
jgi:hypothetical protein